MKTIISLSPLPTGVLEAYLVPYLKGAQVQIIGGSDSIAGADIVLGDYTFKLPITERMLVNAGPIKLIQQPSVGYQHIDVEACRAHGIPVANAAGANTQAVAEHALLLALACLRKLVHFHGKTMRGEWGQAEALERGIFELAGKKWGIIGMGRIGRALAQRLKAFEVEIFYFDPQKLSPEEEKTLSLTYAPLEKILRRADVVSLHCPLTPKTHSLINAEKIGMMKTGALLLNLARGELVDETALASALKTGQIGGAGLDVFSPEPLPPGHPFADLKNVILTPHLAGATAEAKMRIIDISIKNVACVLHGELPFNVVNGVGS